MRNTANRPINWRKVEEYASQMRSGQWRLHAQGIILDTNGNVLTGQKRLWAVVYSGVNVYMRVSRGNPPDTARVIDRGDAQSARDLATRLTGRKHSPTESSIARALCALMGNGRPTTDQLSDVVSAHSETFKVMLDALRGHKKTKALLMLLGAVAVVARNDDDAERLAKATPDAVHALEQRLIPHSTTECWGKSAAFGLAMSAAHAVIEDLSVANSLTAK